MNKHEFIYDFLYVGGVVARIALCGVVVTIHCGCTAPMPEDRDSPGRSFADKTVRYGSIAVVGAGGGYATKVATGRTAAAIAVGVGGGGLTYGMHRFLDQRRRHAYKNGWEDGAAEARAELVQGIWHREAVQGGRGEDRPGCNAFLTRRVFVPSRTINGVTYPAGYQVVQVMPE